MSYCIAFSIDGATDVTAPLLAAHRTPQPRVREEKELRHYTASALAAELNNLLPQNQTTGRLDEQKTPVSRQEAAAEWLAASQRNSGHSGPDHSQGGR